MTIPISDHLSLLPPEEISVTELFELIDGQRAPLGHWLPWVDKIETGADVYRWLQDDYRFNLGRQRFSTFIVYKGKVVGSIGLMRIERQHQRAEMGYWLSHQCQGQGVMTACGHAFVRYCFQEYELNRLEIRSPSENSRSRALALRLGFTREGLLQEHFRLRDEYFHTEIFGLVYREWEKNTKKTLKLFV